MLLEFIENYLVACYDAVGILLMIRVRCAVRLSAMSDLHFSSLVDVFFATHHAATPYSYP